AGSRLPQAVAPVPDLRGERRIVVSIYHEDAANPFVLYRGLVCRSSAGADAEKHHLPDASAEDQFIDRSRNITRARVASRAVADAGKVDAQGGVPAHCRSATEAHMQPPRPDAVQDAGIE